MKLLLIPLIIIGLLILIAGGAYIFSITAPQFGQASKGEYLERIKASKNYGEGEFINQIETKLDMGLSKLGELLKEQFSVKNQSPSSKLPSSFESQGGISDSLTMKWFGHSAILLEMEGKTIFLDPMLGPASSPVPFFGKRFDFTEEIDFDLVPDLDLILISHDHYDHLDYPSILKLKDRTKKFLVPLGVGAHIAHWGVPREKIQEFDWGDSLKYDGINILCETARHFSGRAFTDRNTTLWASWVLIGEKSKVYFSGDGGYGPHFTSIGEKYGPFDMSFIECGQYNEKWADIHMMPEETVDAAIDLNTKVFMPIHWGAFNLAPHAWDDPIKRAYQKAKDLNVPMISPLVGKEVSISVNLEDQDWWKNPY